MLIIESKNEVDKRNLSDLIRTEKNEFGETVLIFPMSIYHPEYRKKRRFQKYGIIEERILITKNMKVYEE